MCIRDSVHVSGRKDPRCGVQNFDVIGLNLFEEDGHAITVNTDQYVFMFHNFFFAMTLYTHVWIEQDGVTTHIARASMEIIKEMFPVHVISSAVTTVSCLVT